MWYKHGQRLTIFILAARLQHDGNLSSLTRIGTHAPCIGRAVLTPGLAEKPGGLQSMGLQRVIHD